ncbi:MAG: pyridoxal-phosphate dependent enzyme, partial [Candidatus Njordarchaeum guaymaensis]
MFSFGELDAIYRRIIEAKSLLNGVIHKTPLDRSKTFSQMTSSEVYLKLENLQKTGSFKIRGAYYKIKKLPSD